MTRKVAIITGAARSIGKAIAFRLAQENYNIVIADILEGKAENVKNEIEKTYNQKALFIKTDITSIKQMEQMVEITINNLGRIDVLVNNAGIMIRCPFLDVTEEIWDKILDINTKGTFFCSQIVARRMIMNNNGGKIINIASFLGKVGYLYSCHAPYEASKSAVITMTKQMAIELSPYKINVNAVAPGLIETEMTEESRKDPDHIARVLKEIPLKRYGTPEDITGVVSFLTSDDANYMTGTTVFVDGGWLTH